MTVDRNRLAAFGIMPAYPDAFGNWHDLEAEAAHHLLWAMDVPDDAPGPPTIDTVIVARVGDGTVLPEGALVLEDGAERRAGGPLPDDVPPGYHLLLRDDDVEVQVIVAPPRCRPHPTRQWGWAVQLYALRSAGSWGVGDLADLRELGRWSRQEGAGVILVNPLDDPIPMTPRSKSPYYPSSRRFRDLLYLRVDEVPGIDRVADELPALARAARGDTPRIDRDAVIAAKLAALEALWADDPATGHEPGYTAFAAELGRSLTDHATFAALAEQHNGGWERWPARFHDPTGPAVAEFATTNADRIHFHAWTQWLLDTQLADAAAAVPLMRDLPIGVDPRGADEIGRAHV